MSLSIEVNGVPVNVTRDAGGTYFFQMSHMLRTAALPEGFGFAMWAGADKSGHGPSRPVHLHRGLPGVRRPEAGRDRFRLRGCRVAEGPGAVPVAPGALPVRLCPARSSC